MLRVSKAQAPFPAEAYNVLPDIDVANDSLTKSKKEMEIFLNKISDYQMQAIFSLHLVHKNSDLNHGEMMVHETVKTQYPWFQFCSPRSMSHMDIPRGLHFKAEPRSFSMIPYDYTLDEIAPDSLHDKVSPDSSQYSAFLDDFSRTVIGLGLHDVFGLVRKIPTSQFTRRNQKILEVVVPSLRGALFVNIDVWKNLAGSWSWTAWNKAKYGKVATEWGIAEECKKELVKHAVADLLGPTDSDGWNAMTAGFLNFRLAILPHSKDGRCRWSNTIVFDDSGNLFCVWIYG